MDRVGYDKWVPRLLACWCRLYHTIPYHTFFCIDAIAYLGREDEEGKEEAYLMTMT